MFEENNADKANEVEVPEVLASITKEDGTPKYSSVEEGLKALAAAQEHIKTLEAENSTFREDLSKRQTAEELLNELKAQSLPGREQDQSSSPSIDLAEVSNIVERTLSARETAQTVAKNQKSVVQGLEKVFGEHASAKFAEKAAELNLSVTTLEELAGKSPSAVLSYFKEATVPEVPRSSGSVNTDAIANADKPTLSAKVPVGASTKDMVNAWKAAGELIKD